MLIRNKTLLPAFLGLTLLAASCSGGKDKAAEVSAVPGGHDAAGVSQSEMVRILPADPTATSTIQAAISAGDARFLWERNGVSIDGETGDRLAPGKFKKGDEIKVIAAVNGKEFSATAVIANSTPSVTRLTINPKELRSGVDVSVEAEGKDTDNDPVSFRYQWIVNGQDLVSETGPVLKSGQFKRGDTVSVRVLPWDGTALGEPLTSPAMKVGNSPPEFTSTPPREFSARLYTYKARAADPDGDEVKFSVASGPEGMSIAEDGTLQWQIKNGTSGTFDVSIVADDGHGGRTVQDYKISVSTQQEK